MLISLNIFIEDFKNLAPGAGFEPARPKGGSGSHVVFAGLTRAHPLRPLGHPGQFKLS